MRHQNSTNTTKTSFFKPEPLKLATVDRLSSRNSLIDKKSSIIPQETNTQIIQLQNEQLQVKANRINSGVLKRQQTYYNALKNRFKHT